MPFAEGTPTVSVKLGRKVYELGWTWGTKRRLREWFKAQNIDPNDASAVAENLAAVIWVSMDKESRAELSVEGIEELINPDNEVEVSTRIGELFKVSEPDVKAEPVAVEVGPTTGTSSSTKSEPLVSTT